MTNVSDTIIAKIQKLLNLAEKNTEVNEQAAAYAKAQQLLTEYNLTMADLESKDSSLKEEISDTTVIFEGKRIIHWKNDLAKQLCWLNGCSLIYRFSKMNNKLTEQKFVVVGRPSDAAVVSYFFSSITGQIEALCKKTMETQGEGKSFADAFKTGAVQTVVMRLQAAKHEAYAAHEAQTKATDSRAVSSAMVLIDQRAQELKVYMDTVLKPGVYKGPQKGPVANDGYQAGKEAGHQVSLTKGLNPGETPKLKK